MVERMYWVMRHLPRSHLFDAYYKTCINVFNRIVFHPKFYRLFPKFCCVERKQISSSGFNYFFELMYDVRRSDQMNTLSIQYFSGIGRAFLLSVKYWSDAQIWAFLVNYLFDFRRHNAKKLGWWEFTAVEDIDHFGFLMDMVENAVLLRAKDSQLDLMLHTVEKAYLNQEKHNMPSRRVISIDDRKWAKRTLQTLQETSLTEYSIKELRHYVLKRSRRSIHCHWCNCSGDVGMMRVCSRCKMAYYCSRSCQKK